MFGGGNSGGGAFGRGADETPAGGAFDTPFDPSVLGDAAAPTMPFVLMPLDAEPGASATPAARAAGELDATAVLALFRALAQPQPAPTPLLGSASALLHSNSILQDAARQTAAPLPPSYVAQAMRYLLVGGPPPDPPWGRGAKHGVVAAAAARRSPQSWRSAGSAELPREQ